MKLTGMQEALSKIGSIKKVVSKEANSPLQILVSNIAMQLVSQFKSSLIQGGVDANSVLAQSIAPTIITEGDKIRIQITSEDYWDYVNSGVDGITVKHGSPYSFKTRFPNKKMAESIQGWMGNKGISDASNYKSISYAIATKLKVKGIEPNHFVDKVLTPEFIQEISLSLAEELGKEVLISINNN